MSTLGMYYYRVRQHRVRYNFSTSEQPSRPHSVLVKDPNLFEDPETFNPSCFLPPQKVAGNWNGKVDGDLIILFGSGRRVCPGMHVALQSTFLCMATVRSGSNNLLSYNWCGLPTRDS